MTTTLSRDDAQSIVAERFVVAGRRRFDPMSVSRASDFRLRPAAGVSSDELTWTPYCYDAASKRVALVGTSQQIDLAAAPFYYQAQYQHAQQLMLVDAQTLQALAAQQASQFTTPVMIYSTGRAGTTLVSKMFGRLRSCESLSEPDLHTSLLEVGALQTADILRAGDTLYFQPKSHDATHLVLKFRGMCVELAEHLRAAHPGVVEFFLYRDAEAYVISSMRAFSYFRSPLWAIRWVHGLYFTRPVLTRVFEQSYDVMCRYFPASAQFTPRELAQLGPVGLLTLSWLSMMQRALSLRLPSLRYENMMRDPRAALECLLSRCGIEGSETDLALQALGEDSQHGSVVARRKTSRYELSRHDRETIRQVLARHELIRTPDYELPNAIA